MRPPAVKAAPRPGGNTTGRTALTGQQMEAMTRAAHRALEGSGVVIGPSKVSKLIRRFGTRLAKNGTTFHEFLTAEASLTPQQQRRLLADPDYQQVISYADPTGETAVNRVLRRGR